MSDSALSSTSAEAAAARNTKKSLDPTDWSLLRKQAHRILDDTFDYLEGREDRQSLVWQPMPEQVRESFKSDLPTEPSSLTDVYKEFCETILPYVVGNTHPGYMGWVDGGGTCVGVIAEMISAGINANCSGRDHSAIEVEKQVAIWLSTLFKFPEDSSGLFVTGSSMANFIALLIARHKALPESRVKGLNVASADIEISKLVAYTSNASHSCVSRAMEYAGLGSDSLRRIATDIDHRIDLIQLQECIESDRALGFTPFLIVGTAGTVGIGAIDDLNALAAISKTEGIHFHVDGAFGAMGILSPEISLKLTGIELADSIALDFHKWVQVPYDCGFLLSRNANAHKQTFATAADYLSRTSKGLSAGATWPTDLGPDLSRGFRALKAWFSLKVYGIKQIGEMMDHTCQLARYLEKRVSETHELELMAPVPLNIVCFRYRTEYPDLIDNINEAIVMHVQENGIVAPSTTRIKGALVIRAAIFIHRTTEIDIDNLISEVVKAGALLKLKVTESFSSY